MVALHEIIFAGLGIGMFPNFAFLGRFDEWLGQFGGDGVLGIDEQNAEDPQWPGS